MESPSTRAVVESSVSRPQNPQRRRGVRVVGKIRASLDGEPGSSSSSSDRPLVSVVKSDGGHASISFADQAASRNESYELDWCYEQDESVREVFSKEVKPLLEGLFYGKNACVMACGARRSGKTQLIQGSEESPGLALMTIREILSFVEKMEGSVSISCYEVKEDHLYDTLELKGQEVQVLEDGERRIQLKGLSRVPVKSDSDFKRIYFLESRKSKVPMNDAPLRSHHKGLIIYVSTVDKRTNASHLGKFCFLDLAGYEEAKPKSNSGLHLTENAKVNKSLFQLLNVVYALNASENYVPYRESKLTRLLQEFLGKASEAVLITCLSPNLNLGATVHVARMASRACQVVNQRRHDPFGKHKNSLRHVVLSSYSNGTTNSLDHSRNKYGSPNFGSIERKGNGTTAVMKGRNQLLFSSTKKVGISLPGSIGKERNGTPFIIKGRKLIEDRSPTSNSMQGSDLLEKQATEDKGLILSAVVEPCLVKDSIEDAGKELGLSTAILDDSSAIEQSDNQSINPRVSYEQNYKAEDDASQLRTEASPPLSERIRKISNSLKILSSQPLSISTPQSEALRARKINMDNVDPKTPVVPFNLSLDENTAFDNTCTPQDRFKTRSTGLKKSLVQECLAFLNSANKEELKELKGIGEKRASYILELREDNAEPFKTVDDLKVLGLSSRQINEMMRSTIGDF